MAFSRSSFRPVVLATAAIFGATTVYVPRSAYADDVSSGGKGTVGGGLLGAEVVTMVESLADVRAGWAYAVGAVVGAAGGATGGYFVDQGSNDGRAPSYLLAGGLALIIPAVVLTLNGTRYRPQEGVSEDHAPVGPPADPGTPGGGVVVAPAPPAPPPPAPTPPPPPTSLLDVGDGAVRMGVPVPNVRPVYSVAQQRQYGMRSETELHMPVLHVTF